MILPTNFKPTIKALFYDKTISIYSSSVTKDSVGWTKKKSSTVTGTFKGNVNFNKLEKMQEEYGITEAIDIAITTDQNIALETILGYGGKQFKVIRAIPFDSHYLIFAQKWLSRSST